MQSYEDGGKNTNLYLILYYIFSFLVMLLTSSLVLRNSVCISFPLVISLYQIIPGCFAYCSFLSENRDFKKA